MPLCWMSCTLQMCRHPMDDRIKRSRHQEKRVAKRLNARVQPRSGAGWIHKSDVRDEYFLYEMKRTDAKQITIKSSVLTDLYKHSLDVDRIPVLHIELCDKRYVILSENDFEELREHYIQGD